ncbi:MAG: cyclic nucleotide-binding domain-containing protein, partial [Roseibium sp.]
EIALITGRPRSADVKALGYCQLLTLSAADYRTLMDQAPDIKAHMDSLSSRRQSINAGNGLEADAGEGADTTAT